LEEAGCVGPNLTGIVINILLYVDDIIVMMRIPHELGEKLRILKDFFSNMGGLSILTKQKSRSLSNPIRSYMILSYTTTKTWRKRLHIDILESIFTTSSTRIIAL
jgi:hypothetical protein